MIRHRAFATDKGRAVFAIFAMPSVLLGGFLTFGSATPRATWLVVGVCCLIAPHSVTLIVLRRAAAQGRGTALVEIGTVSDSTRNEPRKRSLMHCVRYVCMLGLQLALMTVAAGQFWSAGGPRQMLARYTQTVMSGSRPCLTCGRIAYPYRYRIVGSDEITTFWYCSRHAPATIRSQTGLFDAVARALQFCRIAPAPILMVFVWLLGLFWLVGTTVAWQYDWRVDVGSFAAIALVSAWSS